MFLTTINLISYSCTDLAEVNTENGHTETDTDETRIFVPGSIHSKEVRDFWRKDLKANKWVMNTLEQGYVIPFDTPPPVYEEPNNATTLRDLEFAYQAILDLKESGVIEFTNKKPHCVSPLSVSYKIGRDGSVKKRLCLDGSRCINKCIKEQKVTLAHLQRALELTRDQDYQVTYDLKSAYHHIKIHPDQTKYLGAAITNPNGEKRYFVFLFLPFGISSAVHCITKLIKPINAFFHERGIRHSIYLDDGRITAESKNEAEEQRVVVYYTLEQSGWIIEMKKSDGVGDASQCKGYLGFIIDTATMSVRMEETKKQRILQQTRETIAFGLRPIPAKELAKTLGKMVAAEPALGTMVFIATRAAYVVLNKAVDERGWNSNLTMTREALDGLCFFVENFNTFDNTPIRTTATEISIISIIGPPTDFLRTSFVANHTRLNESKIWASDSSGYATCAYSVEGEHLYYRGLLNEQERQLSSGHRELLAVTKTLKYYEETNATNDKTTNIYWLTDSSNMVSFLTKGSGKNHIQSEVLKIMVLCQRLKIKIIPIHLLRDDPRIQVADDGSKTTDTDDWEVDAETFKRIDRRHKFTIDLFASNNNTKCQKFFSNFYCQGTFGIDAFSHSWERETAWICPPIREVIRVVRRLRKSKTRGVLFIPEWRTADFWTEIFDKKGNLMWPFKRFEMCRPFIIQGTFNYRSPFTGRAKFNFLEITFDSH